MTAPICFIDTETTGLADTDEIWEFAAIVRRPGNPEVERHFFIEHDLDKAAALPERFRADHDTRYDQHAALSQHDAVNFIRAITRSTPEGVKAHIVAANPTFDTAMLTALLARFDIDPAWSYHLIDISAMALGYLHAKARWLNDRAEGNDAMVGRAEQLREMANLPYKSDDLARACGIDPDQFELHTALGDARMVAAWYDRITGA